MNYIMIGIGNLKFGVFIGVLIYIAIVIFLYVLKIRRIISWKCIYEMIFCIYCVTLLRTTGIFTLEYSLDGIFNYNLLPFIGNSIVPVVMNFTLFVPYGFLLPLVFCSCKWNWKKIVIVGGLTSLGIELLQMFGGRYAEIDDLLINTFGAFSGYIIYTCIYGIRKNRKKAFVSIVSLCFALIVCFIGIYAVGDNEKQLPDGLHAVESNILEVNVYFDGEKQMIEAASDIYNCFASQISNCGGHLLETENISDNVIWNNDCFIEIIYDSPQNIAFENAENLSIENIDRILYNASQNVLYWGCSDYQNCLDYTKLDEELQTHRKEILQGYEQLPALIISRFEQN